MSEVKTDKISSVSTNGDITLDPDGTGDTIIASGNLGVGTASPSALVHVVDGDPKIRLEDSDAPSGTYNLIDGNGASGRLSFSADDGNTASGSHMRFLVDGSEAARINNNGDVTIGKSNAGVSNDGIVLYHDGFYAFTSSTTGSGPLGYFYNEGATANGFRFASFRLGSFAEVGTITTNGSSTTSYNTTSDYRLKENVVDMTGAITRVKQLAPKRFNFIVDDSVTVDGFLAHEAQTVVPESVTGTHNEVDDDGNAVMQGIDQAKLVPLLTGALQEAIAKIETLETKVAALEAAE